VIPMRLDVRSSLRAYKIRSTVDNFWFASHWEFDRIKVDAFRDENQNHRPRQPFRNENLSSKNVRRVVQFASSTPVPRRRPTALLTISKTPRIHRISANTARTCAPSPSNRPDVDVDETESSRNHFDVKIVMHECIIRCLRHGFISGAAQTEIEAFVVVVWL